MVSLSSVTFSKLLVVLWAFTIRYRSVEALKKSSGKLSPTQSKLRNAFNMTANNAITRTIESISYSSSFENGEFVCDSTCMDWMTFVSNDVKDLFRNKDEPWSPHSYIYELKFSTTKLPPRDNVVEHRCFDDSKIMMIVLNLLVGLDRILTNEFQSFVCNGDVWKIGVCPSSLPAICVNCDNPFFDFESNTVLNCFEGGDTGTTACNKLEFIFGNTSSIVPSRELTSSAVGQPSTSPAVGPSCIPSGEQTAGQSTPSPTGSSIVISLKSESTTISACTSSADLKKSFRMDFPLNSWKRSVHLDIWEGGSACDNECGSWIKFSTSHLAYLIKEGYLFESVTMVTSNDGALSAASTCNEPMVHEMLQTLTQNITAGNEDSYTEYRCHHEVWKVGHCASGLPALCKDCPNPCVLPGQNNSITCSGEKAGDTMTVLIVDYSPINERDQSVLQPMLYVVAFLVILAVIDQGVKRLWCSDKCVDGAVTDTTQYVLISAENDMHDLDGTEEATEQREQKLKELNNFSVISVCLLEQMRDICSSLCRVQFISVMKRLQQLAENSTVLSDENLQDMSKWPVILSIRIW